MPHALLYACGSSQQIKQNLAVYDQALDKPQLLSQHLTYQQKLKQQFKALHTWQHILQQLQQQETYSGMDIIKMQAYQKLVDDQQQIIQDFKTTCQQSPCRDKPPGQYAYYIFPDEDHGRRTLLPLDAPADLNYAHPKLYRHFAVGHLKLDQFDCQRSYLPNAVLTLNGHWQTGQKPQLKQLLINAQSQYPDQLIWSIDYYYRKKTCK